MTMVEEIDRDSLGRVVWHSTDEESGPDVGITVGLGENIGSLWLGEISTKLYEESGGPERFDSEFGWFLIFYPTAGDPQVLMKSGGEHHEAREFIEHTLSPLLLGHALLLSEISKRAAHDDHG